MSVRSPPEAIIVQGSFVARCSAGRQILRSSFRLSFLLNPVVDGGPLESIDAAQPKVGDAAIFDDPIHAAAVAFKVRSNFRWLVAKYEWFVKYGCPIDDIG
jgi:hypothetical protein